MTPQFNSLRVVDVRRETADSVSVRFEVPAPLRAAYRFAAGQFLTLRTVLDGKEERRSYSICCGEDDYARDGELRVAIKRVAGGRFSTWANAELRVGDMLDVMTPDGRFQAPPRGQEPVHYAAFAAGSGITPVLALIKTLLARQPRSRFTLVYGNRKVDSILFLEELEDLKDRYVDRLALHHVLSRQPQESDLLHGRLDQDRCGRFLDTLLAADGIDEFFVCGPEGMIDSAQAALLARAVEPGCIHIERFGVPDAARAQPEPVERDGEAAALTVILDGKTHEMRLPRSGTSVLDTALDAGLDLPYACKGGVCCTCRARLLEGEVRMDRNYTLEPDEIARGFVLTCQSHPLTDRIVVSYDER